MSNVANIIIDAIQTLGAEVNEKRENIMHLLTELDQVGWISVDERLPENGQMVLTYGAATGSYGSHDYLDEDSEGNRYWFGQNREAVGDDITFWMRIPPIPKS